MTAKRKTFWIIGGASAVLLLLVVLRVVSNARASRRHDDVDNLTVAMTRVQVKSMPMTLSAVGQVLPLHTVQIRPQVSGMLKEVYFTEGQYVTQGQRLFLIDPAPFQAALASAKAAWENAKANADRLAPLAKQDYATQQELDDAQATADQDQAAYQQAQINLGYTDIRAPISGRTGSLAVKSGNILAVTDANPLVVINQMQPIQVQFNLAQQFLPQIREYDAKHALKVLITREDGSGNLDQGSLVFIDNAINTSTGTVMFKASLPNQHEQLWPGQYVGVTLQLAVQADAVVVPQSAVLTGQDGNYVYLVEDGKAEQQDIKIDRQIGDLAVVSSGLKGGETLIIRVPRNLRAGMTVTAGTDEAPPAPIVSLPGTQ
ncbi:MAG TPA: efflux RND transporter periplasmic adaptor subunit [Gammaproteobacteria bacterium]|nr:efflux RND transporter periplasmic adaptor subunit [Gammaproteobacteria bacterium]